MVKFAIALCALSVSSLALAAPESLSKVDTKKGEILLEVQASGTAMRRISKVSSTCTLRGSGVSKETALTALKKEQDILKDSFAKAGLGAAALDFSALPSANELEYPMAIQVEEVEANSAVGAAKAEDVASYNREPAPSIFYSQSVGITVTSMTAMEKARALMSESSCDEDYRSTRRPNIEIADVATGKTEATANAIKAARAQADNYATALGMKVVGMIRVSETGMIKEFLGAESEFWMQELRNEMNRNRPVENDVPISANVLVDFVLGPKS
jgi:hypothetical protein